MDPGNPTAFRGGVEIELKGSSSDPDAGESAILHWHALLNHNETHVHDLDTGEGNTFVFETGTDHDQPSRYEVVVYAEDERHLRTELPNLILKPETSVLQLTSTPSGAVVTHGGGNHTTPYTGKSTIGVEVGISTVESFVSAGVEYRFDSWSNGGLRSQAVTMPEGGLSLNANYVAVSEGSPPEPNEPQGGGLGDAGDIFPVALAFNAKHGLANKRKAVLRGTASDDSSGVDKVQVALRQAQKAKGRCRWWSQAKDGFPKGTASCGHPAYMTAKLKGSGDEVSWTVALGGHLLKGRYLLFFRTEDVAGNSGGGPSGSKPVPLVVK